MRRLLTVLIAAGMLMSGMLTASAQDAVSAVATGTGSPVTWTDERGNQVATMQVTNVENDWQGYGEYYAPERGYIYVAVTFEVTNTSESSLIVGAYDFSMMDAEGRNNGRSFASVAEDSDEQLFEEDAALADGETVELKQVFEVPNAVPAAAFIWQPDSGILLVVDVSEGAVENSAIASGLNTSAIWTDDRGNPVATIEVTGINTDWQDYGEYYEPERGMVYVAIDFKVTNVSSSNFILEQYDFSLLDNTGLNNSRAWAEAAENADPVFSEDVPIAAGETHEGTIVFALYDDLGPSVLVWQPDSGVLHFVMIGEGSQAALSGTPAATPQG
jgi:predicted heme/steroid binding protein